MGTDIQNCFGGFRKRPEPVTIIKQHIHEGGAGTFVLRHV